MLNPGSGVTSQSILDELVESFQQINNEATVREIDGTYIQPLSNQIKDYHDVLQKLRGTLGPAIHAVVFLQQQFSKIQQKIQGLNFAMSHFRQGKQDLIEIHEDFVRLTHTLITTQNVWEAFTSIASKNKIAFLLPTLKAINENSLDFFLSKFLNHSESNEPLLRSGLGTKEIFSTLSSDENLRYVLIKLEVGFHYDLAIAILKDAGTGLDPNQAHLLKQQKGAFEHQQLLMLGDYSPGSYYPNVAAIFRFLFFSNSYSIFDTCQRQALELLTHLMPQDEKAATMLQVSAIAEASCSKDWKDVLRRVKIDIESQQSSFSSMIGRLVGQPGQFTQTIKSINSILAMPLIKPQDMLGLIVRLSKVLINVSSKDVLNTSITRLFNKLYVGTQCWEMTTSDMQEYNQLLSELDSLQDKPKVLKELLPALKQQQHFSVIPSVNPAYDLLHNFLREQAKFHFLFSHFLDKCESMTWPKGDIDFKFLLKNYFEKFRTNLFEDPKINVIFGTTDTNPTKLSEVIARASGKIDNVLNPRYLNLLEILPHVKSYLPSILKYLSTDEPTNIVQGNFHFDHEFIVSLFETAASTLERMEQVLTEMRALGLASWPAMEEEDKAALDELLESSKNDLNRDMQHVNNLHETTNRKVLTQTVDPTAITNEQRMGPLPVLRGDERLEVSQLHHSDPTATPARLVSAVKSLYRETLDSSTLRRTNLDDFPTARLPQGGDELPLIRPDEEKPETLLQLEGDEQWLEDDPIDVEFSDAPFEATINVEPSDSDDPDSSFNFSPYKESRKRSPSPTATLEGEPPPKRQKIDASVVADEQHVHFPTPPPPPLKRDDMQDEPPKQSLLQAQGIFGAITQGNFQLKQTTDTGQNNSQVPQPSALAESLSQAISSIRKDVSGGYSDPEQNSDGSWSSDGHSDQEQSSDGGWSSDGEATVSDHQTSTPQEENVQISVPPIQTALRDLERPKSPGGC